MAGRLASATAGWVVAVCMLSTAVVAAPVDSLPSDADCDGVIGESDLDWLQAELDDGDGSLLRDADGGAVVSCSGVDANGDGRVTAADLTAMLTFLSGQGTTRLAPGPIITFIGTAAADGTVNRPINAGPLPLHQHAGGVGLLVVVEADRGPAGNLIGQQTFNFDGGDPGSRPDLQVALSNNLGDGSDAVCDDGGVPGTFPPSFAGRKSVSDALNDVGCRFSVVANPAASCTLNEFRAHAFVNEDSRVQFCLSVSTPEAFADGDTMVTVQLRDAEGNLGVPRQIMVHIGTDPIPTSTSTRTRTPTNTPAPSSTRTPTPTGTPRLGPSRTASPSPIRTRTASVTPTRTRTGTPTQTVTGTLPATPTPTRTRTRTPTRTVTGTLPPTTTPTRTATVTRSATRTVTRSATVTRTPSRTGTVTPTGSGTPVNTATRTRTRTRTPTDPPGTATRTRTRTRTRTPTEIPSSTRTETRTPTPTRTETATRTESATRTATAPPTVTGTRFETATRTPTRTLIPTRTGSPTRTATRTRTHTRTPTTSPSRTETRTRTETPIPTATRTRTATLTGTSTRTPSRTPTQPNTRTPTATRTASRTRTVTPTLTVTTTATITRTPTATRTVTATRTLTVTRTATQTRTATFTPTITRTPTITLTPTITRTPTETRTITPTVRPGADISYVGVARPDDTVVDPVGVTPEGWPIFERPFGFGFTLVIEGVAPNNRRPGLSTFDDFARPDLQIIVSRPLGDGSLTVCDDRPPIIGGVPASASFADTQAISNALNDLGCRFVDGSGLPKGRGSSEDACTRFSDGGFRFVAPTSRAQFCGPIAPPFGFPVGDTVVTVRLADMNGAVGTASSFVIRVLE